MIRSISNSSSSDSARSIPASECSCVRETGRAVLDVARQNQLLALHHIHDSAVLHSVVPDVDARLHLGCESRTALHLDHMTEGVTPEHAPMQRTWWFCMAIQRLERCHARRLAQCRPVPDVRSVSSRTSPKLARQTSMQHHDAACWFALQVLGSCGCSRCVHLEPVCIGQGDGHDTVPGAIWPCRTTKCAALGRVRV